MTRQIETVCLAGICVGRPKRHAILKNWIFSTKNPNGSSNRHAASGQTDICRLPCRQTPVVSQVTGSAWQSLSPSPHSLFDSIGRRCLNTGTTVVFGITRTIDTESTTRTIPVIGITGIT